MIVGTSSSLLGKEWIITKAYTQPDGSVAIEGWISTPLKDMEKDVLEPEAFQGEPLAAYMQRGAPISTEHDTKGYPVGYLQKATLVRNGRILQEEYNPKQPRAEYRYFDPLGVGWYGLGVIYDEKAAKNVSKGAVGAFSWIGKPNEWEDLGDGGRRFSKQGAINPLLEVTITAYPINRAAIMRIAKAYGYDEPEPKKLYIIDLAAVVGAAISSPRTKEVIAADVKDAFSNVFDVRLKGK